MTFEEMRKRYRKEELEYGEQSDVAEEERDLKERARTGSIFDDYSSRRLQELYLSGQLNDDIDKQTEQATTSALPSAKKPVASDDYEDFSYKYKDTTLAGLSRAYAQSSSDNEREWLKNKIQTTASSDDLKTLIDNLQKSSAEDSLRVADAYVYDGYDQDKQSKIAQIQEGYNSEIKGLEKMLRLKERSEKAETESVNQKELNKRYSYKYKDVDPETKEGLTALGNAYRNSEDESERSWIKSRIESFSKSDDIKAYTDTLYKQEEADSRRVSEPYIYDGYEQEKQGKAAHIQHEYGDEISMLEEALPVKQRKETYDKYMAMSKNADFAEYSKEIKDKPTKKTAAGEVLTDSRYLSRDERDDLDNKKYMTDDEQAAYNYVLNTMGKDQADEFYKSMEPELNERMSHSEAQKAYQFSDEHPVLGSLQSVGYNLISGGGIVEDVGKRLFNQPVDTNTISHLPARLSNAERQAVKDNIPSEVGQKVYDVVMTTADSAANMLVTKGVGSAAGALGAGAEAAQNVASSVGSFIFSSQAATQEVIEAKDKGLDDNQAILLGVIHGVAEYLSEKYSIETILNDSGTFKEALAKAGLAEGSEEVVSNWLTRPFDVAIESDKNELIKQYNSDIEQGATESEALANVLLSCAGEDVESFVAGGVSGMGMSATSQGVNKAQNAISSYRANKSSGNNILNSEDSDEKVSNLITDGKNLDEGSAGYKLAQELEEKQEQGKKLSASEVGKLDGYVKESKLESVTADMSEEEQATVINAAEKLANGQALSDEEVKAINDSSNAAQAVAILTGSEEDETNSLIERQGESAAEYKTSSSGKTEVDGKAFTGTLEIKSIGRQTGDVTYNLIDTDGTTEERSVLDLKFDSDETTQLHKKATAFSNINEANAFVDSYEKGQDVDEYTREWDLYSNYGRHSLSLNEQGRMDNGYVLSDEQKMTAYSYGLENYKSVAQRRKIASDALRASASFGYEQGTFNNTVSPKKRLNKEQKNVISALKIVSGAGINVEVFESKADKNDMLIGENGSFDVSTKTLRVDINAGYNTVRESVISAFKYGMLNTAAHELTHVAKHGGSWDELRNAVVNVLEKGGKDFAELTDSKLEELQDNKKYKDYSPDEMKELAEEEAICEACESMLQDGSLFEELVRENPEQANKLLQAIRKVINSIKSFFKTHGKYARSKQGKALLEAAEKVENDLQAIWNKAVKEGIKAANAGAESNKKAADEGGIKAQFRDTNHGETSNEKLIPYTESEKQSIEMHGNVVVDSFQKLQFIVHEALTTKGNKSIAYFGKISAQEMNHIQNSVTNMPKRFNGKLFVSNKEYSITVSYDSIRHLVADKKLMGEADVIDYLDKLSDTIIDFDTCSFHYDVKGEAKKNGLLFKKAFSDGVQSSYDLYSNKKYRLSLKTTYLDKTSYIKKKFAAPVPNQQSLGLTSMTHGGQTSNINIPQSSQKSNTSSQKNQDRDYLSAVDHGDMETARKMVDEAAERAFADSKVRGESGKLLKVYHGSDADFTIFEKTKGRANMDIQGMFFSPWELDASGYGSNVRAFYLNITNPASETTGYRALNSHKGENQAGIKAREDLERMGYDGVNNEDEEYVAFYSSQIKSADPVTYDDDGEVIPLSERFNTEKKDIRYQDRETLNEYAVSSAVWDALDHEDKHHDNLIKIGVMPRYIQSLLGISGDFYIQRNHTYENTVTAEQAKKDGRYSAKAHYHALGIDKMTRAIMSIEHPIMTIDDTRDNGYPAIVMILDEVGNNGAPIYAAFGFYVNRPINGKHNIKPHIVLTIAERDWFKGEGRDKSYEELIQNAIEQKKVIDYDAKKRNDLSVIAENVNLGNITVSFLNKNLSQFKKEINSFKEKNKISYQDRTDTEDLESNRYLLATALESVAKNEKERRTAEAYKGYVSRLNDMQEQLDEINAQIREISFTKGSDRSKLRELKNKKEILEKKLNRVDAALVNGFETTQPVRDMIDRAKRKAADKMRKAKDKKIAEVRQTGLEKLRKQHEADMASKQEQLKKLREDRDKKLIAAKEKRENDLRELRDTRDKNVYIGKIKKLAKEFQQMALRPNDKSYVIPEFLRSGFYEAAQLITDAIKLSDNTKVGQGLNEVSRLIGELAKDDFYRFDFNEDFRAQVDEFTKAIKGKKIDRNLTLREAEDIYRLLKDIKDTIRDANKLLGQEEGHTIHDTGLQVIDEQNNIKRTLFNKYLNKVKNFFMTPERMSNMINGYDPDAALVKLFNALKYGLRKKNRFFMEANKPFDQYRREHAKELDSTVHEVREIVWYDNSGGEHTTRMTGMQAMQLVMTWNREAADNNLVHLTKGGITLPNPDLTAKGKLGKAYEKSTKVYGLNQSFITEVQKSLTEFERGYIKLAEDLFNRKSTDAINEVSLILKHREIAKSKYYIPISVDSNELVKDIDGIKFDASVENMGMLKSITPKSDKSVLIVGLDSVINKHIDNVSKYYGLAIPIRNLNKVLNVSDTVRDEDGTVETRDTVRAALQANWGKLGENIYTQLLTDLQTSRNAKGSAAEQSANKLIRTIRSNFVTSTLNANKSVVLKQAASFSTAGVYLDHAALVKGLAVFNKNYLGPGRYQKLLDEIDSHTAQHYIRRAGLSSNEISDIQSNWFSQFLSNNAAGRKISSSELAQKLPKGVNPNNWIQEMDCLTTAALWCACKAQLNADYDKEGKAVETEEYWQELTDLYDKVIEDTQPMYDPMHRPEVLKLSNELIKSVFMFKTQPLQNAGIIYDAVGRLTQNKSDKAAKKQLRKAVTSQIESLMTFALMSFGVAFLLHNLRRYKDDDDELTVESVLGTIFSDMGQNGAGLLLPLGGSELVKGIFGNGDIVSDNVLEPITQLFDSGNELVKTIGKEFDNNSLGLGVNADNILKAIDDFAITVGQGFFGLPVKNVKKNLNGYIEWAKDLSNGNGIFDSKPEDKSKKQIAHNYAKEYESGNTSKANQILTDFYNADLEKQKADPDVKYPEKKARANTRDMLVNAYKTDYQKAFLRNDTTEMRRIEKILYSANEYMKWGDYITLNSGTKKNPGKLTEWRSKAKEDLEKKNK